MRHTWGWATRRASLISERNRRAISAAEAASARRILRATVSSSTRSWARYTAPIPPRPRGLNISKRPPTMLPWVRAARTARQVKQTSAACSLSAPQDGQITRPVYSPPRPRICSGHGGIPDDHELRPAGPQRAEGVAPVPGLHELRRPRLAAVGPRRGGGPAVLPPGPRRRAQFLRHR